MGKRMSNLVFTMLAMSAVSSVCVPSSFNTAFDYSNTPRMNNSKKHKAKSKKLKAKRNRKR